MKDSKIKHIEQLVQSISMTLFGFKFQVKVSYDDRYTHLDVSNGQKVGRIYLQIEYLAPCTKDDTIQPWKGRKWYLSDFMTDDEVIKTCYVAFKGAVEHELMEGFKINGVTLFNPHTNYEALLSVSGKEITRG